MDLVKLPHVEMSLITVSLTGGFITGYFGSRIMKRSGF